MADSITNGTRKAGTDIGKYSLASGINNEASGLYSAAIGANNIVKGECSAAFGVGLNAYSKYQTVMGQYNELDANNNYSVIIGGGKYDAPKNIFTLDWDGNATFAGNLKTNSAPSTSDDLVNLDYFNKNATTKYFPHTEVDESTIKIYVDELEAYTSYKVRMDKPYKKIMFFVRANNGSEQFLLDSDATINKYNMFVGAKLADEMYFNINAVNYRIIFAEKATGIRVIKSLDSSFTAPTFGESCSGATIDDKNVSANSVYSSHKAVELLNTKYDNISYNPNNTTLSFYAGTSLLHSVNLNIPKITQTDIDNWNSINVDEIHGLFGLLEDKIDKPTTDGLPGQVLTIGKNGDLVWAKNTSNIGDLDLTDLEYTAPGVTNAKEAFDDIYSTLDVLTYKAPNVVFTSNPSGRVVEVGQTISNIIFNWTVDKDVISQSINGVELNPSVRQYVYDGMVRLDSPGNYKFTLSVNDGKTTVNKSISFGFKYRRLWGAMEEPAHYNNDFFKQFTSSELADSAKKGEFSVTAGPNQYIYYCIPVIWDKPIFNVGGFDGGFSLVDTVTYENEYTSLEYNIYRSDYANLGTQNIIVR